MTTSVTWSLFSGRTNPQFQLTEREEKEFVERLRAVQTAPPAEETLEDVRPFGFGVFSITNWTKRGAIQLRVGGGIVAFPFFDMAFEDSGGLEPWLIEICPELFFSPSVKGQLFEILKWRPKAPETPSPPRPCIPPQAADSPPFEAFFGTNYCQCNNCYDYANNQRTNTFSQPGFGSGQEFASHSCADLIAAAERDGLVHVQDAKTPLGPGDGWYVALLTGGLNFGAQPDFHWLRQDDTGCWSHKLGGANAVNFDFAHKKIYDPEQANLGQGLALEAYDTFCGYFRTQPGVTIKGHKSIYVDCYDPMWGF